MFRHPLIHLQLAFGSMNCCRIEETRSYRLTGVSGGADKGEMEQRVFRAAPQPINTTGNLRGLIEDSY